MRSATEEMYAAMKPWRLFFTVAMPGMISMFAMSLYSIVEGIFIGQTLGESAFAAINTGVSVIPAASLAIVFPVQGAITMTSKYPFGPMGSAS